MALPPERHSLPYFSDSAKLMLALNSFDMPAFLDSAGHGGDNGQFDILAASPIAYISIEAGRVESSEKELNALADELRNCHSLINKIRELKEKYLAISNFGNQNPTAQKFTGAIISYLGYPKLKGKSELIINNGFVGVYLWAIVVDHSRQSSSIQFHPSCSEAFQSKTIAMINTALAKQANPQALCLTTAFKDQIDQHEYQAAFEQIKTLIDQGDCYQVNLTQSFKASCSGDPLDAYLSLRRATSAPFSAYMSWSTGALLSLSPERFISLNNKSVLTQPIKGTRPRGKSAIKDQQLSEELSTSTKDRAENLMIVDLLRNDLGQVCETGTIKADQLFTIESFSNVHHMVSSITGTLAEGHDGLDLLESCYPGGSITGAPKLRAMEIIEQVEVNLRKAYCGTVFYLNADGNLDSSITIRSLLWQPGELQCWAGGGIVADSHWEQEYQECFDKISNIFKVLQK